MRSPLFGTTLAALLAVSPVHAATIGLTLTPDTDPMIVSGGETVTWVVGITPDAVITGYTIDIRYDMAELTYVSAEQLVPFFGGAFVPPFQLDPGTTPGDMGSTGLASSESGRASYIGVNNSEPVGPLFSLTFMVNVPPQPVDGLWDLTVGILNDTADDINPEVGGDPFDKAVTMVGTSVGTMVPEPASLLLIAAPLARLVALRNRRRC